VKTLQIETKAPSLEDETRKRQNTDGVPGSSHFRFSGHSHGTASERKGGEGGRESGGFGANEK
jgi:hypothetical protein